MQGLRAKDRPGWAPAGQDDTLAPLRWLCELCVSAREKVPSPMPGLGCRGRFGYRCVLPAGCWRRSACADLGVYLFGRFRCGYVPSIWVMGAANCPPATHPSAVDTRARLRVLLDENDMCGSVCTSRCTLLTPCLLPSLGSFIAAPRAMLLPEEESGHQ